MLVKISVYFVITVIYIHFDEYHYATINELMYIYIGAGSVIVDRHNHLVYRYCDSKLSQSFYVQVL